MFAAAGCSDERYVEGSLTTLEATEVAAHSAVLNGEVKIVYAGSESSASITNRGFMLGTSQSSLTRSVRDGVGGEGKFSCNVADLTPKTKYYARAYATLDYDNGNNSYSSDSDKAIFYGNIVEFVTGSGE